MLNQLENHLRFQHTALTVLGQRQQLLAANIANADTPHYRARDVDFRAVMASVAASNPAGQLRTTHPHHVSDSPALAALATPLYRTPAQGAVDGNTVEMDAERAAFADNTLRYEASLRFLNSQFSGMQKVIAGQ